MTDYRITDIHFGESEYTPYFSLQLQNGSETSGRVELTQDEFNEIFGYNWGGSSRALGNYRELLRGVQFVPEEELEKIVSEV